jgi:hypothetical protein
MFCRGEEKHLRNAVVLDEAHRVARLKLISGMMQECRKYGIPFLLSSQRVEDFNQGFWTVPGITCTCRLTIQMLADCCLFRGGWPYT